jgi:hypothetical protein
MELKKREQDAGKLVPIGAPISIAASWPGIYAGPDITNFRRAAPGFGFAGSGASLSGHPFRYASMEWMAGSCLREAKLRFGESRQARP